MKINFSLLPLALFSFLITSSCTSDEVEQPPKIHFEDSSLEVMVRIETDTGLVNAIGAIIKLYETEEDRRDDYKPVYESITNAEGKHLFTALRDPEYWISVKSSFDGSIKFFNDDTPYQTPGHPIAVNRLDVFFEK